MPVNGGHIWKFTKRWLGWLVALARGIGNQWEPQYKMPRLHPMIPACQAALVKLAKPPQTQLLAVDNERHNHELGCFQRRMRCLKRQNWERIHELQVLECHLKTNLLISTSHSTWSPTERRRINWNRKPMYLKLTRWRISQLTSS
jgi:hypothetical protein